MEAMFGETTEQLEISDDASATGVTDEEVDMALAEVDAELSLDTRQALPSVPGLAETGEITDLEKEIARLKSQRD